MDFLPGLGGVMSALGIAVVTGILGFKLSVATEPASLYTKLIPYFSSLLLGRFFGQFKVLLHPLKVSAYMFFLLLKYPANILIWLTKRSFWTLSTVIGALFISTVNLMPELVQQRILAIDRWLAGNYWIWDDGRLAALIVQGLFPFWNNGPANALLSLADHVNHAAERSRKNAVLRDILGRYEDVQLCGWPCSTRFLSSNREAGVQLISTSLGVLDSLNAVKGEPSGNSVPPTDDEARNTEEYARSVYMDAIEELLDKAEYRHWMIDIPDRGMAWHLYRDPEGANTTIERKESVKELTTVAMGVKLTDYKKTPLGSTFLSNLFLVRVMEIEEHRRRLAGQEVYDLLNNNCHSLWTNGMLDLLICKCDSTVYYEPRHKHKDKDTRINQEADEIGRSDLSTRKDSHIPSSIAEALLHRDHIIAYCDLFMSAMIALGKRNILPLGLWRPRLSILAYVLKEFNLSIVGPVSPALTELFGSNKRAFYSFLAVIPLHTVISFMYHRRIAPSRLEWIDMGIGIGAIYWVRRIRRSAFSVEPVQPAMCWSSFFSQLYEMRENGEVDKTQLEEDIKAFLHTDLYVGSTTA